MDRKQLDVLKEKLIGAKLQELQRNLDVDKLVKAVARLKIEVAKFSNEKNTDMLVRRLEEVFGQLEVIKENIAHIESQLLSDERKNVDLRNMRSRVPFTNFMLGKLTPRKGR